MNKNFKKILLLVCVIFLFALVVKVCFAQETDNTNPQTDNTNPTQNTTNQLNVDIPGLTGEVTLPKYIKAVYQFGIGLLAILAMGMIMIGGYQYMFSAGDNITKTSDAKAHILNALIGLFIALTSFLLLNTINPEILEGVDQAEMIKLEKQPTPKDNRSIEGQYCNNTLGFTCADGLSCSALITDGTCRTATVEGHCDPPCKNGFICKAVSWSTFDCVPTGETINPPPGAIIGTDGLYFQSLSIANQYNADASAPLKYFLTCMQARLPSDVGIISSISDDHIDSGTCTIWSNSQNAIYDKNHCQHAKNSCHYGGATCEKKSYAVDYGDSQNAKTIRSNAAVCYPNSGYLLEGNHVHISIGAADSCGCDVGMEKP